MDKKQIRKTMRGWRAKLSRNQVLEYSGLIWGKIYEMPAFRSAATILLYSSFGNEVDTVEIATRALDLGKRIAYPVTDMVDMTMAFYTIDDLSELEVVQSGSFRLREPKANSSSKVVPDSTTLMIVPGLAFDKEGYRTGYGGGFYDKYMAEHQILRTIGVCYSFQVADCIPRDVYDQPVGLLVTEINRWCCRNI